MLPLLDEYFLDTDHTPNLSRLRFQNRLPDEHVTGYRHGVLRISCGRWITPFSFEE